MMMRDKPQQILDLRVNFQFCLRIRIQVLVTMIY